MRYEPRRARAEPRRRRYEYDDGDGYGGSRVDRIMTDLPRRGRRDYRGRPASRERNARDDYLERMGQELAGSTFHSFSAPSYTPKMAKPSFGAYADRRDDRRTRSHAYEPYY